MSMSPVLIEANQLKITIGSKTILDDVSFTIHQGQAWAITGPAGSGKSTLAKVIANHLPVSSGSLKSSLPPDAKVVMVAQQHRYKNRTDASATYYQARFDSLNSDEFPIVEDVLREHCSDNGYEADQQVEEILKLLQITYLRHTRLIQLSNGENKRLQLAKALLQHPHVLILDNPFVGLDQATRAALHSIINQLISTGITILLITTPTEIPKHITHVMELQEGCLMHLDSRISFLTRQQALNVSQPTETWLKPKVLETIPVLPDRSFDVAIRMQNVTVHYGGRTVLDQVNWQVNRGEKWALSGPNGAGKSTLLSLINGDNPQAYANAIDLFDKRKGSGESIWDIKRRIGYISPELHLYFDRHKTCFKTVASGLTDTMVYDKRLSEAHKATIDQWLDIFRLTHQKDEPLATLPLSAQRLVLLARAMVKNPPVLILDEPCQGLDAGQTRKFKEMVDTICRYLEKTLIFVSHYPEDIPECVDRMLVLQEGKASEVQYR